MGAATCYETATLSNLQPFAYRRPRLLLEHPLHFCLSTGAIAGESKDVSEAGVLARLIEPVSVGTQGRIRWRFGGCLVELDAHVAHTNFLETGLLFDFRTDSEKQFVQTLVKLLAKGPPRK